MLIHLHVIFNNLLCHCDWLAGLVIGGKVGMLFPENYRKRKLRCEGFQVSVIGNISLMTLQWATEHA